MDRNELNLRMEELKIAMHNRDFEKAVDIADTLDLKKIRDNNFLSLVADAYEVTHRYKEAKKALLLAYENTDAGRHLAYRLCLIAVKTKELDEAQEFYEDFVEMAPRDTGRYILKYRMAKVGGEPIENLIAILEEYVNIDMEEKWAYELAKLYHMAGNEEKCVEMCDEISLWFADGKYVNKAMDLKKRYQPLSSTQQETYDENKKRVQEEQVKEETKESKEKVRKYRPFQINKDAIVKEEADLEKEAVDMKEITVPKEADSEKVINSEEVIDSEEKTETEMPEEETVAEDIEAKPLSGVKDVEDILKQLQERGILKAETVQQAVHIINEAEEQKEEDKEIPKEESAFERWEKDNEPIEEIEEDLPEEEESAKTPEPVDMEEPLEEIEEDLLADIENNMTEAQHNSELAATREIPQAEVEKLVNLGETREIPQVEEELVTEEQVEEVEVTEKQDIAMTGKIDATPKVPIFDLSFDMISKDVADEKQEEEKADAPVEEEEKRQETDETTENQSQKNLSAKVEIISGAEWEQPEETEHIAEKIEAAEDAPEEEETEAVNVAEEAERIAEEIEETDDALEEEETEKDEELEEKPEEEQIEGEEPEEEQIEIPEKSEFVLTEDELRAFNNYLNVEGFEENLKDVLEKLIVNYEPNGKSTKDNVVIMGEGKTGKTTLAIELIKLVNKKRGRLNRRVAKIDAEVLNRKGLRRSLKKLLGCDLIIESAQELGVMTLSEIVDVSGMFTDDMLIVLEGKTEGMEKLLADTPRISTVFNHVIKIKEYDVKEWVEYGIRYAQSQGYSVDELANLAFHKAVDDCFGKNNGIGMSDVEDIVDRAIDKSGRLGRKISGIFSSNKDENGMYILVESDFNI